MKKLIIGLVLLCSLSAQAQFPTTDSLRKYINKWIRNSAVDAFTNLRLNTALLGMTRFADSTYGGQVQNFVQSTPGVLTLTLLNGDVFTIDLTTGVGTIGSVGGGASLVKSATEIKSVVGDGAIDVESNTNTITIRVDSSILATRSWVNGVIPDSSVYATRYYVDTAKATLRTEIQGRQIAGNYITQLNGDVIANGPGNANAVLANTTVIPGTYTNTTLTIDAKGRVTAAANGSGGGGGSTDNILLGSGYRPLVPSSQGIKTLFGGYGVLWDSTSYTQGLTVSLDSSKWITVSNFANKISYGDTSALFLAYRNAINLRVKYSDTATMLDAYESAINGKQPLLGYTPENIANKSTSTALGSSNTLYPSQNAVKVYVDAQVATKQDLLGYTPENVANKSTNTALGSSNVLYPTQNAVKTYVDNGLATKQDVISLTTTGTSGAATLVGSTLNIPQYAGATYSAGYGLALTGTTFRVDTATILAQHLTAINARVKYSDTAAMLLPYANKINTKQGIIALTTIGSSGAATFDGATLNIPSYAGGGGSDNGMTGTGIRPLYQGGQNLRTLIASTGMLIDSTTNANSLTFRVDTATIFTSLTTAINNRIRFADTTTILSSYLTAINSRVKYSDTSTMLTAYRNGLNAKQPTITLTTTGTSGAATLVGATLNIPQYAGTTYTAGTRLTLVGTQFNVDSLNLLAPYQTAINARVKYSDTTSMLASYITSLNTKVKYTDTAAMLLPYANKINTKQGIITLTTIGASGAATFDGTTLNIPSYAGGSGGDNGMTGTAIRPLYQGTQNLRTLVASSGMLIDSTTNANSLTFRVDTATIFSSLTTAINARVKYSDTTSILSTYQTAINTKQGALTLTTTGSSGAATLIGNTLNIPSYSGGSGMTNPMTTIGDVIYGGASGTPTRLGIGTLNYVLTSNGAGVAPSWKVVPTTTYGTGYGIIGDGENNFLLDTATVSNKYIQRGAIVAGANVTITGSGTSASPYVIASSASGLTDGDKGDITVSSTGSAFTVDNGAITNVKVAAGIDAVKLADGTVTNAEFQFINSLTSNAQTQLDAKQATLVSGTNIRTINGNTILGSTDLVIPTLSDGDKTDITVSGGGTVYTVDNGLAATKLADGTVTSAEFQYINSLSSNAQTQINGKERKVWFNILDYGADPTGVANSTAAIQAAIDAAYAVSGGVIIPQGTFLSNTITWYPEVEVKGVAQASSIIKSAAAEPLIQYVYTAGLKGNIFPMAGWSDVRLDGNSLGTIGFNLRGVFQSSFNRIYVGNFTSKGVNLAANIVLRFNACNFYYNPIHVYATSAIQGGGIGFTPSNLDYFDKCVFVGATSWAVDWYDAANVIFKDCDFEVNGTAGNLNTGIIRASDFSSSSEGMGLVIDGGWCERNYGTGVLINNSQGRVQHTIKNFMIQFPGSSDSTVGIRVNQSVGFLQNVFLTNVAISGQSVDVRTNGANARVAVIESTIGVHQEFNSGVYFVHGSVGTSYFTEAGDVITYSKPTDHTGIRAEATGSGKIAYLAAEAATGNEVRLQANASESVLHALTNQLSLYSNGVQGLIVGTDGGITFPAYAGAGGALSINTLGQLVVGGGGGGGSQWATLDANNISYTGTTTHTTAAVISPVTTSVAAFKAVSFDGVDIRLQANPTAGFIGTVTNHGFSLYANSIERIEMPAAGGVKLPGLAGGGTQTLTVDNDGFIGVGGGGGSSQFTDETFGIRYTNNANSAKQVQMFNNSSGTSAQALFVASNGTNTVGVGMTGTAMTTYGSLTANMANLYSAVPIMLMGDNSSAYVAVSGGGNAETVRFITSSSIDYINFGNASGSSSYGFRDNAGTLEYKNSGGSWAAFSSGGGGSNWTVSGSDIYRASKVGIGTDATTPAQLLDIHQNQNAATGIVITNTNAGSSAFPFINYVSDTKYMQHGVYSSGHTAYGQLTANAAYTVTDAAKYVTAIDNASGRFVVAIGAGVATERLGIAANGVVTLNSLSGNGAGYVAVDNNGVLSWSAGSGGGGFTSPLTTTGDLLSYSGSHVRIAAGTSGYYLGANGAGVLPSWKPLPGSGQDANYAVFSVVTTGATGQDLGDMTVSSGESGWFEITVYAINSSSNSSYGHVIKIPYLATSSTTISFGTEIQITVPDVIGSALASWDGVDVWDYGVNATTGDLTFNVSGMSGQNIQWRIEVRKHTVTWSS